MNKKIGFGFLLSLFGMIIIFSGCASTIPITNTIIREVGGLNNTPHFQYYVSSEIILKLVEENKQVNIEGGRLVRRSQTARQQIIIPANLPGIVRHFDSAEVDDNVFINVLVVAFENYEGDPVLWFTPGDNSNNGKYFLMIDDNSNSIVRYGNDDYYITWKGNDDPYLMIRMTESSRESSQARRASGLRVGQ